MGDVVGNGERELYEAARYAVEETVNRGASLPFNLFLERIEQLLGRRLTDDETGKIMASVAKAGLLYSCDRQHGKRTVGFKEV
jgi:hypothetical protein